MQQDSLKRFARMRPFLGYRLLEEAGLVKANENAMIESRLPDAHLFATSPAKAVSERTRIPAGRVTQMQELFQARLRDSSRPRQL